MKSGDPVDEKELDEVAPLVGAWIEITISILDIVPFIVAPLVGAWIEIGSESVSYDAGGRSSCRSVD